MFQLFIDIPWLGASAAALLGLLFGSFANVVIARLPVMLQRQWQKDCAEAVGQSPTEPASTEAPFNLAVPRSRCPHCKTMLRWYENIPVLSFLWLRARCRTCHAKIAWRYPLIELSSGLLVLAAILVFGFSPLGWSYALFLYLLLILAAIDRDHMILPDSLTLPLLWLGLLLSIHVLPIEVTDAVLGAAAGYGALWSIFWLFKLVTGKEGMGYGDFKLLAALGAWLGWQMLPMIILLSSVVGAVIGLLMMVFNKHKGGQPIPFGPFLVLAGMLALFFGERIYTLYWQWLGL